MSEIILSVSQLNEYVRGVLVLDPLLGNVSLRGEISALKRHTSGHMYFSLKDDAAVVRCVMFRQHATGIKFQPSDGMRVVLQGSASIYVRDGSYQFYAERMRADGEGALHQAFLAMRDKLESEGLFARERKRPLPALPSCVGVVTSETGAAIRDIIRVARRRNPGVRILLSPALVQGEDAPASIVAALRALAYAGCCDVIIVGRGGGSAEDLWAFNTEEVARALAACPVPTVSAVGHEVDVSIADFVADVRAATPSMAAELCVPELETLQNQLDEASARMRRGVMKKLQLARLTLDGAASRFVLLHPGARIARWAERIGAIRQSMRQAARAGVETSGWRVETLRARMESLAPARVLARGYAIVEGPAGIVTRAKDIAAGERIRLRMADGAVRARVEESMAEEERNDEEAHEI